MHWKFVIWCIILTPLPSAKKLSQLNDGPHKFGANVTQIIPLFIFNIAMLGACSFNIFANHYLQLGSHQIISCILNYSGEVIVALSKVKSEDV